RPATTDRRGWPGQRPRHSEAHGGWGFPPPWAWIARRVTRMAGGKVVDQDLKREVLASAEQADIKFVSLQFTDVVGVVKNVTIPLHKFEDAIDYGLWFDGSSIEGFARIHESDMFLAPDLRTFAPIPWELNA